MIAAAIMAFPLFVRSIRLSIEDPARDRRDGGEPGRAAVGGVLAGDPAAEVPGGEGGLARLALVSILLSIGALVASEWMVRRARYRAASE